MSNALTITQDQTEFTPKQLSVLENLGVQGAAPQEVAMFFDYCQRTGLSPWARQIYMIGRWDRNLGRKKYAVQVSIDGQRLVAERSGVYEGQTAPQWCGPDGQWVDVWLANEPPQAARVGVWRKSFREPAYGVARLSSYMPVTRDGKPQGLWGTMPDVMLAKCFTGDTEILTGSGFVRLDEFNPSTDQVAQVTDRGLELTDAEFIEQPYGGEMITSNGDMLNFKVTPNHDMVTTVGKVEAGAMYATTSSRGPWRIPMTVSAEREDDPTWTDDDLRLAGYITADGSWNGTKVRVEVSRAYKREALDALGAEHTYIRHAAGKVTETATRSVRSNFDKTGYSFPGERVGRIVRADKTLSSAALMSLSPRQARVFVDAWIEFDGHENRKTGVRRVYTSREDHVRAFELAAVHAGYSVNVPRVRENDLSDREGYALTVSGVESVKVVRPVGHQPGVVVETNDDGRVYCVRVPSGRIIVRRNGFSMVCGNCAESLALRKAFPLELSGLYTSEEMQQADAPRPEPSPVDTDVHEDVVDAEIVDDEERMQWIEAIQAAETTDVLRKMWADIKTCPDALQAELRELIPARAKELAA